MSWTLPAERLASVEYSPDDDPDEEVATGQEPMAPSSPNGLAPHSAFAVDGDDRSKCLQRIGEDLYDVGRVARAVEEYRLGKAPPPAAADVLPGSALETALASIWRKVLGRPHLGVNDNFFEAGGTSLRAVQVIAMIKKELNRTLSIVSLFECPTVRLLAVKLGVSPADAHGQTTTAEAALRGQQRRYGALRPKAS
jgi:hypothetical protein